MSTTRSSPLATFFATGKQRAVEFIQSIVHAILGILFMIGGDSFIAIVKEGELHRAKTIIELLRSSINMAMDYSVNLEERDQTFTRDPVLVRQNQFAKITSDVQTVPEENVAEKKTERTRYFKKVAGLARQNQFISRNSDHEDTPEENVSEKKTEHMYRKGAITQLIKNFKASHVQNLPLEKAKLDEEISWLDDDKVQQEAENLGKQLFRLQRELIAEQEASQTYLWHARRLETKIRNIEEALRLEKENHNRQHSEVEKLQEILTVTREEFTQLKEKLAAEKESCTNLLKDKFELELKNQELQENCRQLTQANTALETEVQNLDHNSKASVREREEKSKKLEKQLANLEEALREILESEVENRTQSNNEKKMLEVKVQDLESALGTSQANLEEEAERSVCKICFDRPRNALCMPCRHFVCCQTCLKQHMKSKTSECPVCRKCIKEIIECYT